MLFSDSYFTVATTAGALFKDRGSKFFAFVFPVQTETEIKMHLQELRKKHPSARHHCYAWRLGPAKEAWRANDDGEPSGTAGKPILAQIQSNDLTNVLIVVVRYFGGTLLGVSGLIHAYRNAAAAAIQEAGIKECFIVFEYEATFNAEDTSAVMRALKENGAKLISSHYENGNKIIFRVKKQDAENIENKFTDLYTAKLKFIRTV